MLTRNVVGRWGWVAWGLTLGSLLTGACGSKDDEAPPGTSTGNTGNTANSTSRGGSAGKGTGGTSDGGMSGDMGTGDTGTGGTGDTGTGGTGDTGTGGMGEPDAAAPVVKILNPKAETDPNGDGVLVDSELDVICRVTQSPEDGSNPVAKSTIVLQMLDADDNVVPSVEDGTLPGQVTDEENEYSAHFILTKVPDNGKVSFRCLASDTSDPPLSGSSTITTLLDHGPTITRSEPKPDSPHPQKGAVHVEFSVDAAPVAKGDKGATVASVELVVGGVTVEEVDENDGVYTADVDLSDASKYPTPPSGDTPITIRAANSRKPKAVTAVESYSFIVDGEGPEITITTPGPKTVAGGLVTLGFDVVDDASGVDPDAVTVTMLNEVHQFDQDGTWTVDGDHYTYTFDSRLIENTVYQANLLVRAQDRAGNESPGASRLIFLDNVPPIVDLNPPNVRMWRKVNSAYECSASFDPLGKAIGDTPDNVTNLAHGTDNSALVRALVWDMTNKGPGARLSGVKPGRAQIYVQPNTDQPLLVDVRGGPECDDIDESAQANLELFGIVPLDQPKGVASFSNDGETTAPPISGFANGCTLGTETAPPAHLCTDEASDLTTVIRHNAEGHPPVVFALEPTDGGVMCTGDFFELSGHATEGWVCLVGRAEDEAGNIGISRPLRICYDDFRTSTHPSCLDGMNPPSCTDGCDLPPTFPTDPYDYFVTVP